MYPHWIALALTVWLLQVNLLAQGTFYVESGSMILTRQGDPSKFAARHWQVRLYPRGANTQGETYWGLISAKSSEAAMLQLKESQEFETLWTKTTGLHYGENTYFNYLGPIAILDATKSTEGRSESLDAVLAKIPRIATLMKQLVQRAEEPKTAHPKAVIGSVLKEYVKNIRDARDRVAKLAKALRNDIGIDVVSQINEADKSIRIAAQSLQPLIKPPGAPAKSGRTTRWTHSKARYRLADGTRGEVEYAIEEIRSDELLIGCKVRNLDTGFYEASSIHAEWRKLNDALRDKRSNVRIYKDGGGTYTLEIGRVLNLNFTTEHEAQAALASIEQFVSEQGVTK